MSLGGANWHMLVAAIGAVAPLRRPLDLGHSLDVIGQNVAAGFDAIAFDWHAGGNVRSATIKAEESPPALAVG